MNRLQTEKIVSDLEKKMVFLVGPRQVGKTWLAKEIGQRFSNSSYLNFDQFEDRKIIEKRAWLDSTELLILDELHKMKSWKNYLKGLFDTKKENLKILVTGSARLETFRQAGDSLAGRFFLHRLLPFSSREIKREKIEDGAERLLERGGFPEPFLAESETEAERWRKLYADSLIRTDVLDFENISDLRSIQLLFEILRRKVGSPISINSIAEDLKISHATVSKYIQVLEALFIIFKVHPFSKNIARSILKEPKIYFFDNGLVEGDAGAKFENLVAVSLLKSVYGKVDQLGENWELKYLRTKDNKEVDFCLAGDNKIIEVIEAKNKDDNLSRSLAFFCKKYGLKGTQLVRDLRMEKKSGENIEVRNAENYLEGLFL